MEIWDVQLPKKTVQIACILLHKRTLIIHVYLNLGGFIEFLKSKTRNKSDF